MAKGKHEASKPKKAKTKKQTKKRGGRAWLIVVCVIVALAAVSLAVGAAVGRSDKIHPNVEVYGTDVGAMTVKEAAEALKSAKPDSVRVTLPGDYEFTFTASDAGLESDPEAIAEAAYKYGHSGSPFKDLIAYVKCLLGDVRTGDVLGSADKSAVADKLKTELRAYSDKMAAGYDIDEENSRLVMVKGQQGAAIDADKLADEIVSALGNETPEISYKPESSKNDNVDFDALHEQICGEAVSAEYDKETGEVSESRTGIEFDTAEAKKLWDEASDGDTVRIPISVTKPKITTEQLKKSLFADKLGSMTTNFASSNSNRANNVELAASKIDGYVLNPGETFSFNDVVGKRTAEAGFKAAGAYAGGKVVQELGGGICQVSSTLYCAAMYANLEIVARDEHGFAVGYVPWGMDATVSWGGPEFKFKNNRDYPIKIVAKSENRRLTVEIWGTDVDGSYVKIDYSSWTVYDSTYPTVAIGTGAQTYRCVYDKDGNLISRNKEASSFYHYHPENIQWPTTPSQTPTTPRPSTEPEPTEAPAETTPAGETESLDP